MGSLCPRHASRPFLFLNSTGITYGLDTPVDTGMGSLGPTQRNCWRAGGWAVGGVEAEPVSAGCHLLGQPGKRVPETGAGPLISLHLKFYLPLKYPLSPWLFKLVLVGLPDTAPKAS